MIIFEFVPGPELLLSTTPPARVLNHWNSFITLCPTSSRQFFTVRQQEYHSLNPAGSSFSNSDTLPAFPPHEPPDVHPSEPSCPCLPRSSSFSLATQLRLSMSAEDNLHPDQLTCSFKKGAFLAFLSI